MYDPRYSPVYQIPYQPLYEVTRHEIQHGLLSLQQKLRRRRQIDRQIAHPLVPYPSTLEHLHYQHDNLRRIQQQNLAYRAYEQQNLYRLKVASQFDNAARIQNLRKERDQLAASIHKKKNIQTFGEHARQSFEDDELIKKYENGSIARKYYEQLQNQRNRIQSQYLAKKIPWGQQYHNQRNQNNKVYNQMVQNLSDQKYIASSPIKKQIKKNINHKSVNNFLSQRKDHLPLESNFKRSIYQTPYDKINQNHTEDKRANIKDYKFKEGIKQQLQKRFNKIDQVQDNIKEDQIPNKNFKKGPDIVQKQEASPLKRLNKHQSLGKIIPMNRSKSNYSPFKRSYFQDDYLQAKSTMSKAEIAKKTIKQIELDALKKIQNRLRVSKVIYEDSQFRNIKYEGNHLYNTYDIQVKQRRELRQKINKNSIVLRKHPLVVQ